MQGRRRERGPSEGGQRALAVGLGLAALALGCGEPAPPAEAAPGAEPTAVVIERLAARTVRPSLTVPGLVEAERRIELAFRVPGTVERIRVEEGDAVEAGAVLAELERDDYLRAVRAAEARLARAATHAREAERKLESQRRLLARESTSREAFQAAESAHAMARAEEREARVALEEARVRAARTVLRAPADALVERRLIEAHERTAGEEPVLVLAQIDRVTVRAALADAHLARLRPGTPARITTPLHPGRVFEGRVARLDVAADAATRTVPFEVELANEDRALRPELAVDLEIPLGEPERRLLVPLGAVLRDAEAAPFCFVATGGEGTARAERRRVALGALHGERVAIERGLAEGERVIVRGQHFLREGDPVRALRDVAAAP